jgi:hypothetical protein
MGWVRLPPYNIAQKVQVVVEHFRTFVAPLLDGKAKAMVVVGIPKRCGDVPTCSRRRCRRQTPGIGRARRSSCRRQRESADYAEHDIIRVMSSA